ncbi:MAG: hypothetical protein ACKOH8_07615, partial [Gemmatimonadota bacterium]
MRLLRSLVLLLVAGPATAQGRLVRATDARAIPGGATVATLEPRTTWRQGPIQRNYVRVTLEGWIDADRVGGRLDTFPQSIGVDPPLERHADVVALDRALAPGGSRLEGRDG